MSARYFFAPVVDPVATQEARVKAGRIDIPAVYRDEVHVELKIDDFSKSVRPVTENDKQSKEYKEFIASLEPAPVVALVVDPVPVAAPVLELEEELEDET